MSPTGCSGSARSTPASSWCRTAAAGCCSGWVRSPRWTATTARRSPSCSAPACGSPGPATLGDLVMWLDTRSVTAPPDWLRPSFDELAGELEEVRIDGVEKPLHAHAEALAAMKGAPEPPPVLLLPPRDAVALGSRAFLVPDRAVAKTVWRPVGSPGVVLVDGDIVGTWRARQSGRTLRLTLTVHTKLTAKQRAEVERQGEVVAAARGHDGKTEVELD
ncbi:MAG: hypothetical protein GEV28_18390 [Actinophytocola sp.]|uniref:DNA glycosylase AlkZ-like family protein n=1 Tax=Actinophytocola sp. TaxID=1872138 RepID=UPI001324E7A8|nr:crosslink repair DNA glycosylase YcaQ family protein [Actinophytocola sp.]MPZ82254.1 hypothetical protein [Actinophytocola sp.]